MKDSRPAEDGASVRRRRECSACGGRFTTFERVQLRELVVIKSTGKRAPFASFAAHAEGHKVRDEGGNHLTGLTVTFDVTFPEGEGGDAARESLPRAMRQIEERLCTVGRTVTLGDPVAYRTGSLATDADADDSIAPEPDPSA